MTTRNSTTNVTQGWGRHRAADQHTWDDHPHTVWDGMRVEDIELSDILSSTLQVTGIAMAEHRGKAAYRLDVDNVASGGSGRLVFTKGQILCDVKRYEDDVLGMDAVQAGRLRGTYLDLPVAATARPAVSSSPLVVDVIIGGLTADYFVNVAKRWANGLGEDDSYDTDEQVLFAFLCQAIEGYCRLDAGEAYDGPHERWSTLESLAENLTPGFRLVDAS